MLTRLHMVNYRSHGDTTLELAPLNLLIGPVAGGKSNVFRALLVIQNSVHRSLVELFPPGIGDYHWVRSRWADETDPIAFELEVDELCSFPGQPAQYVLRIADSPNGLYVLEETLARQPPDEPSVWVFQRRSRYHRVGESTQVDPYAPTMLNLVRHHDPRVSLNASNLDFAREATRALSSFGYFHLETSRLSALGMGQDWDRIGYYGERLPDFIAHLKSDPDRYHVYEAILQEMREVLPQLEEIIVTQTRTERQGIAMSFAGQRGHTAAPDLSDGTMFTLGLLCIIHSPRRPALLCIEEPETGLHPGRLRWLFDRLMGLAYPPEGQSRTQILISSHSPYLVDFFSDMQDCVKVVDRVDGRSRITPLREVQAALHHEPEADESIGHQWATGLFEGL